MADPDAASGKLEAQEGNGASSQPKLTAEVTSPKVEPSDDPDDSASSPAKSEPPEVKAEAKQPPSGDFKPPQAAAKEAGGFRKPGASQPKAQPPPQPLPYKEPAWARPPPQGTWAIQVMKGGVEVEERLVNGSCVVFGRLPQCDFFLEHPSISRFHAVLQFGLNQARSKSDPATVGWHVMDLGSTHGSKRNKEALPAKQYLRLRSGQMLSLGGSTRLFLLQGPEEDEQEETTESVSELKAKAAKRKEAMKRLLNPDADFGDADEEAKEDAAEEAKAAVEEESGISWGMDYGEEEVRKSAKDDANPDGEELDLDALKAREDYYKDDPKRALRKFFDRTGNEMDFVYEENGIGPKHSWTCRIELPVDNAAGQAQVAEASCGGKKSAASTQCALEACRILDAQGLLHPSSAASAHLHSQAKKRREKLAENDYYSSDEDEFLDRTGSLEERRLRRKARAEGGGAAAGGKAKALTYTQLCDRLTGLAAQMDGLKEELAALEPAAEAPKGREGGAGDALDSFMQTLRKAPEVAAGESQALKLRKSQLRQRLVQLKAESLQVERMAKVAKPVELPKAGVFVGSMRGGARRRLAKSSVPIPALPSQAEDDEDGPASGAPFDFSSGEARPSPLADTPTKPPAKPVLAQAGQPPTSPSKSPATVRKAPRLEEEGAGASAADPQVEPEAKEEGSAAGTSAVPATEPKRKRQRVRKKKAAEDKGAGDYDPMDPDYAVWLPPDDGQSGDGRTALNDKLGY